MKKSRIIFSLLVTIIAATFTMSANAQQRGLFNWQNNDDFNAFLFEDVDSITYSRVGLDGKTYPNVVVQEVWKQDSVYRIPINTIDSVSFKAPKPVFKQDIFHIRDFHYPYVTEVTDSTVTFNISIPSDSLPDVEQIVVSDRMYEEPFMHGFAGRVIRKVTSGDVICIECETVGLEDIFDELVYVGKVITYNEDEDSTISRLINYEGGAISIPYGNFSFDVCKVGSSKVSLDVKPKLTMDIVIHYNLLSSSNNQFKFILNGDLDCNIGYNWSRTTSTNIVYYPLEPLRVYLPYGVNAYVNIGGFFNINSAATLEFKEHFRIKSKMGFDFHKRDNGRNGFIFDVQKQFDSPVGKANLYTTTSVGLALSAGVCLLHESIIGAELSMNIGPKVTGSINFDTSAPSSYQEHIYDHITFTPITANLTGSVTAFFFKNTWNLWELPIAQWFPALATKTYYLYPLFDPPYQETNSTYLTTTIKRDLIFPVTPGIGLYQNNTLKYEKYSSKNYWRNYDWIKTYLRMNLMDYDPGTYTATPCFKIFGKKVTATEKSSSVTIPESISDVPNTLSLKKGETKNITFTGGWGVYTLSNSATTICTASLTDKTITIKGLNNGTATLTLTDLRTGVKKAIMVTVTTAGNPVITVTPSRGDFGLVEMNSVNTKDFTISCTNVTGNLSISLTGDTVFKILSSNNNSFKIQFKPYKASTFTGTVTITASDGTKCTVPLTGESCAITGKDEVNFGDVQVGSNLTKIRKLTGYRCPEAITLVSKTGTKNYEFTVTPTSLPAAGDTLYLTFAPTVTGNAEAVLTFESGPATKTVTLKGNGVATPVRTVTPKSINFGDVALGDTKSALLTIKGIHLTGPLTVRKTNHVFSVNGKTEFTLTPKNGSIDTTLTVTYSPDSVCNNGGYIFITGGGVTGRDTVKLSGRCLQPVRTATPKSINFGKVPIGSSKTAELTITGTNLTGPLTVKKTNHVFSVNGKTQLTLTPRNGSVDTTVIVKYSPDSVCKNGGYIFISGGGVAGRDTVKLHGEGVIQTLTVDATTKDIGTVYLGESGFVTFTLTGTNLTEPVTLVEPFVEEYGGEFDITPKTIYPNSDGSVNKLVKVTYTPKQVGISGASFTYSSGSGSGHPSVKFAVDAKCVKKPVITVTPETYDFKSVKKDGYATKTFIVQGTNLTDNVKITPTSGNCFSISPTTITKEKAMSSNGATVTVTFHPTEVSSYSQTFTLKSAGAENKTINVSGKGATLTVDAATKDIGTVYLGESGFVTFTLTGTNLTEPVTLVEPFVEEYGGEFDITPKTIYPNSDGSVNKLVKVTYTPKQVGISGASFIYGSGTGGDNPSVRFAVNATGANRPSPTSNVDPTSLSFGGKPIGSEPQKTFTVTGSNLTGNLMVVSKNPLFTVDTSTITPAEAASGKIVTVTYKPTTVGNVNNQDTGEINVTGGGTTKKTVVVSGFGIDAYDY